MGDCVNPLSDGEEQNPDVFSRTEPHPFSVYITYHFNGKCNR